MIQTVAFSVGMLFGAVMVITACLVYWKHRQFGLAGIVLSTLGTILIGLSIWKGMDVSINKEGLKLKFTELEQQVSSTDIQVQRLSNGQADVAKQSAELQKHIVETTVAPPTTRSGAHDVISLMRGIESKVNSGEYAAVGEQDFADLRAANASGVGFSVYPAVALAFERQGKSGEAIQTLDQLQHRVSDDVGKGYGYLSRDFTIQWVLNSLDRYRKNVRDPKVASKFDEATLELKSQLSKLPRQES
jgi:hypothetical protein